MSHGDSSNPSGTNSDGSVGASSPLLEPDASTVFALQRLEQGKLQRLGDSLLPWKYSELLGLKSNGLSTEGKTRKGVPDSFVGSSAAECRAAVEYTTQATTLGDKLASDYASVRAKCPKATVVFLCTNRVVEDADVTPLRQRAAAAGVQLTIVDGREIAEVLATERQDLREQFLAIPVGSHSRDSLIAAMAARLTERIPATLRAALSQRVLARPSANRALHSQLASRGNKIVLTTAVAGTGKSTWSAYQAEARAESQPVAWTPANALRWDQPDPIGVHIVQAAFGVPDSTRAHQLVELLRREQLPLLVVLDGIDEVQDFTALLLALQDFRSSAFAPLTNLLRTCREEALAQLAGSINAWRPELLDARRGTLVCLEALSDAERRIFLSIEGATKKEARNVEGSLPLHLRSVPLFLKQSLAVLRGGGEPTTDNIIDSFAKHAVRDIAKRMRRNGTGPSEARIADFLRDLAVQAISTASESVDYAATEQLGDGLAAGEGESSLIGRSVQAGLLEERGERGLGFTHALYLEYFASRAASSSWPASFPDLRSERGRQIARRIVQFIPEPSWLVETLFPIDATAACFCASEARTLPPNLSARLTSALEPLLASRFHSDRQRALNLLGALRSPQARLKAVEWWNGAEERTRAAHGSVATRVFLKLEIPEAFEIILAHHWFDPEWAWYEPSFLAEIAQKSSSFRAAIVARARKALEENDVAWQRRARLVTMLAMFGDKDFVENLSGLVDAGESLATAEFRALLHLNNARAMEVYAAAVEQVLSIPLEGEEGPNDEERQKRRYHRREGLVPNTADVRMYPHDAALALADAALSSSNDDHISFGFDLASLLKSQALLPAYMSARQRRGRRFLDVGPRLIEGLLEEASFPDMKGIFDTYPDTGIRRAVVGSAYKVPGADTERFLLDQLEVPEYRFGAVQSLGLLHARRGGAAILRLYETTTDRRLRHQCITSLGEIGFRPAVPALASQLRQILSSDDQRGDDDEYALVKALGYIGGDDAHVALQEAFPKTHYQARTIQALFKTHSEITTNLDLRVLHENDVDAATIAEGLGARSLQDFEGRDRVTPVFHDRAILARLTDNAEEVSASGRPLIRHYLLRAVARFDLPEAIDFLRQTVRDAEYGKESLDLLAALGDESAMRELLELELELRTQDGHFPHFLEDRLARWPQDMVREAILKRLDGTGQTAAWLSILQVFAKPADIPLFERFERGDDAAADVAHEFLTSEAASRAAYMSQ